MIRALVNKILDLIDRRGAAAECEEKMRALTNGERGCANPKEHRRG